MKTICKRLQSIRTSVTILLIALLGLAVPQVNALESIFGRSESPLSPEEAFRPYLDGTVAADTGEQIQIRFDIEDGYYLYQKKFTFTANSADVTLGEPGYSESLTIEDEYFGKSQIFRNKVAINLPSSTTRSDTFDLTIGYQGCADIGLCYPPNKTVLKVKLTESKTAVAQVKSAAITPKSTDSATGQSAQTDIAQSQINPIQSAEKLLAQSDQTIKYDALPKLETRSPVSINDIKAPSTTTPGQINVDDLFKPSSGLSSGSGSTLLSPDQAFVPSIQRAAEGTIEVRWFIEPGYYMYRDKFDFRLEDAGNATVARFDVDKGKMKNDAYFGDVEVHRDSTRARIVLANADALKSATLSIQSQGCADIGVCFPPQITNLPVRFANAKPIALTTSDTSSPSVTANSSSNAVTQSTEKLVATTAAQTSVDEQSAAQTTNSTTVESNQTSQQNASTAVALPETEQNRLSRLLAGGHLGLIAMAFYIAGLLLAFTACMYPMIPILSSLIVGQGSSIGTTKAFGLSLVYVLSMASVFAVAGILVGLSGYNIQPLFQNSWVLSAFAALFVLLALSMFGLFQLQMPSSVQTKMSEISNKQKSGSWSGVAIMGMLSALIVGPCVTPPLVAALAYIANTGDARIGGIALFAIGIGMGTPLLFIGTSLGRFMPKAGGWMDTMQRIFGVVLIGVAIYMLSRFLPANVIMIMCAVLAIFTGVFFGATDKLDADSRATQRFGKSVSLVALVYGLVLMVGALAGSTSLLSPLKGIVGSQSASSGENAEDAHLVFQRIKTTDDLNNVLAQAKAEGRPVMLDFYADWCISCKEMEAFTFPDKRVKEALSGAVLVQADVTKNDDADKAMLKKFSLFGPPAIILYDQNGKELEAGRVVGYMTADKFSTHLNAYLN